MLNFLIEKIDTLRNTHACSIFCLCTYHEMRDEKKKSTNTISITNSFFSGIFFLQFFFLFFYYKSVHTYKYFQLSHLKKMKERKKISLSLCPCPVGVDNDNDGDDSNDDDALDILQFNKWKQQCLLSSSSWFTLDVSPLFFLTLIMDISLFRCDIYDLLQETDWMQETRKKPKITQNTF